MGSFRKVARFSPVVLLLSFLCMGGVYGAWRYADDSLPMYTDPIDIDTSIGVFSWGTYVDALVEAITDPDKGVGNESSALIEAISNRMNSGFLSGGAKDTFGSMALSGGQSTNETLVGEHASKLDWIMKWEGNNIDNITRYELYSYNNSVYGDLGTNDNEETQGKHYKHMQYAENNGQDPNEANTNLRNNYINNEEIGGWFGVIYKTVYEKNTDGEWIMISHTPGHARAGYYHENQMSWWKYGTHIPAWNCDTWESCDEATNYICNGEHAGPYTPST